MPDTFRGRPGHAVIATFTDDDGDVLTLEHGRTGDNVLTFATPPQGANLNPAQVRALIALLRRALKEG